MQPFFKKDLIFKTLLFFLFTNLARAEGTEWYVLQTSTGITIAILSEEYRINPREIFYQSHLCRWQDSKIEEEHLGLRSWNGKDLHPLSFNYILKTVERDTEVDAVFSSNNTMTATIKQPPFTNRPPKVLQNYPKSAFLSSLFPVWVIQNLAKLKLKNSVNFEFIPEDRFDNQFRMEQGRVAIHPLDPLAKQTGSIKLEVKFDRDHMFWWIQPSGRTVRYESIINGLILTGTTEIEAKKSFFSGKVPLKQVLSTYCSKP